MANGPIGKPKSYSTRSTWAGVAPSRIIRSASAPRMNSMRLPTNPGHTPTITGTLPMRLPIAIVVATTVSDDLAPRTFSSSFMTLAGEKKCMPITLSGRDVTAAISLMSSAEVFDASSAPGLQISSSSLKIDFFSSMSSNTASMTMSQVGEVGLVRRAGDQRHAFLDRLGRDRAARRRPFVVLAHHAEAPVECGLIAFDDRHRNADVGEVHRDAAAHRAGAEDAAGLDVDDRCVLGDVGDLVGGALGEEGIALGGGLRAGHQLHEEATLDLDALVERQVRGRLDALHDVLRREEPAGLAGDRRAELREQFVVALGLGDLLVTITHTCEREVLGDGSSGERHRCAAQRSDIAVDDLVDEARVERLGGADVATRRHHLERLGHAGEAGKTLRATTAGQQAEVDLGQAELRRRDGDPVVRGESGFESTPEGGAVDRGDHRDRRILHRRLHLVEADRLLGAATELGDVGAGDECPAVTDDDDTLRSVLDRLGEPVEQALANVPAQGVHGRVVDHDHGDVAGVARLGLDADGFAHCSHGASQALDPIALRFRACAIGV